MLDAVIQIGRAAVITGAASGIGLETARVLAARGMRVCMVDRDAPRLQRVAGTVAELARDPRADVLTCVADVGSAQAMMEVKRQVYEAFADVALLMNNAVTRIGGGVLQPVADWQQAVQVNIWGVVNGVQCFVPSMLAAAKPAMVINCGSKQGITNPPGNSAYNMTKAAVKSFTESLAHTLRQREGAAVSAHLLIPGWTTTGDREHKTGAWLPSQVVGYMLDALARGDFYIVCPDDEVTPQMDRQRVLWAAGDVTENRPALSRWDNRFRAAFEAFCEQES